MKNEPKTLLCHVPRRLALVLNWLGWLEISKIGKTRKKVTE